LVVTFRIIREKDDSKKGGPNNYRPSQTQYRGCDIEGLLKYEQILFESARGRLAWQDREMIVGKEGANTYNEVPLPIGLPPQYQPDIFQEYHS